MARIDKDAVKRASRLEDCEPGAFESSLAALLVVDTSESGKAAS